MGSRLQPAVVGVAALVVLFAGVSGAASSASYSAAESSSASTPQVQGPAASVSISNQTSNGSSIVVDSYQFGPTGSALAVWNITNGTPNAVVGSITSPANGTNVSVTLAEPLTQTQRVQVAIHNSSSNLSQSTVLTSATAYITVNGTTAGNQTTTPGPAQGPPPSDMAAFRATQSLSGQQTQPSSLGGKLRVEKRYRSNTSVTLRNNSAGNYSLAITVTGNATNVTFFLQKQAVESSQNISNATMLLDGQQHPFYVNASAGPGRSPWILFEVPHFSTRNITFTSNESTTVRDALTGSNDQFSLQEIQQAVQYWATGQSVPGTNGQTVTLSQLQSFIQNWATR